MYRIFFVDTIASKLNSSRNSFSATDASDLMPYVGGLTNANARNHATRIVRFRNCAQASGINDEDYG